MIPANPNHDRVPVSGRDGGPARPCARSQGRGCARPASEGSLDESSSRLDGMTRSVTPGSEARVGCRQQLIFTEAAGLTGKLKMREVHRPLGTSRFDIDKARLATHP